MAQYVKVLAAQAWQESKQSSVSSTCTPWHVPMHTKHTHTHIHTHIHVHTRGHIIYTQKHNNKLHLSFKKIKPCQDMLTHTVISAFRRLEQNNYLSPRSWRPSSVIQWDTLITGKERGGRVKREGDEMKWNRKRIYYRIGSFILKSKNRHDRLCVSWRTRTGNTILGKSGLGTPGTPMSPRVQKDSRSSSTQRQKIHAPAQEGETQGLERRLCG